MRFLLGFLFGASYTRNRVFRVAFLLLILFMVFASTRCQKLLATTGGCCTVSSDPLFPSIRRVLIVVWHETKSLPEWLCFESLPPARHGEESLHILPWHGRCDRGAGILILQTHIQVAASAKL